MGHVRARNLAYDTLPVLIHGNGPTKVGRGPGPWGEWEGAHSFSSGSEPPGPHWELTASVVTSEFTVTPCYLPVVVSDAPSITAGAQITKEATVPSKPKVGYPESDVPLYLRAPLLLHSPNIY